MQVEEVSESRMVQTITMITVILDQFDASLLNKYLLYTGSKLYI